MQLKLKHVSMGLKSASLGPVSAYTKKVRFVQEQNQDALVCRFLQQQLLLS